MLALAGLMSIQSPLVYTTQSSCQDIEFTTVKVSNISGELLFDYLFGDEWLVYWRAGWSNEHLYRRNEYRVRLAGHAAGGWMEQKHRQFDQYHAGEVPPSQRVVRFLRVLTSTARCRQAGTRLVAGSLLRPHNSARPRYVGGLRLPTPPPVCGEEPSGRARPQLSRRTDGQGRLPDVRPENRRHGAGLFSHLSSKLAKMLNSGRCNAKHWNPECETIAEVGPRNLLFANRHHM